MSLNAHQIETAKAAIKETSRQMLSGELSYIAGSRRICDLCNDAKIDLGKYPFATLVGICSETDEVPVGEMLNAWSEEAKLRKETDWQTAEKWAAELGEQACLDISNYFQAD